MAYTPINWQTGDVITAEKLNKMDNGWSVESTQLFSETVTTVDTGDGYATGQLAYVFQQEPPAEVVVTFDGTDYVCERDMDFGYGGYDGFSTYPFYIAYRTNRTDIYTEAAGTYTVTLATSETEVSANFRSAVDVCVSGSTLPMKCIPNVTTYDEMQAASAAERLLYFYYHESFHLVIAFNNEASPTAVTAYPAGVTNVETYGFDDDMVFAAFTY